MVVAVVRNAGSWELKWLGGTAVAAAASAAMLNWWIILCRRASIVFGPGELYFFGSPPISSRSFGFSVSFNRRRRRSRYRYRCLRIIILCTLIVHCTFFSRKKFKKKEKNNKFKKSRFIHAEYCLPYPLVRLLGPKGPPSRPLLSSMTWHFIR